jgi:predicted aldo/keto reductase-like oxidoreductase
MQYRKFGKLDWQASALGFGCMRLPVIGNDNGNVDQEKATEMIRYAIDHGVNYMDTAYLYHNQRGEAALGKALKDGYRAKVHIATKLPVIIMKDTDDFDRMLDEELERLQTDSIDFYLLHSMDREKWEKALKLNLLKKAEDALADGRIRHLGFSFHDKLDVFKQMVDGYDKWTFCQIQYNYMDVDYQAGKAGLQYAANKGLAVVIMEPLRGGRLALELPAAKPLWAQAKNKRTPADWGLQWLWSQPEVSVVLSGMSTLQQVKENVASADNSHVGLLNADELELIDKIRDTLKDRSPIGCTACEYCMPCPNGVNIPGVFDYYNRIAMFDDLEGTRFHYKNFMENEKKAENCIQCETCLSKCPQHIPISDWMPVIDGVLTQGRPYQTKL